MKKIILEGETGSGKTYQAINNEIVQNNKFVYIAPCRQLVYESFMKYASNKDALSTGEVKIAGLENTFSVFESLRVTDIKKFDTVIIDEAHFITDNQRGQHLQNIIKECEETNTNIVLVTATRNFELNDFEVITLKSRFKVPNKVEIDFSQFCENIDAGMQTIIFVPKIDDTYYYTDILKEKGCKATAFNSSMSPSERLELQIAFAKKEIQTVVCTNVLGQGVNFECENMLIQQDFFNTPELLEQKLGRLGRPFLSNRNEVYYCLNDYKEDIKKKKIKIKKKKDKRNFEEKNLVNVIYDICNYTSVNYNDVKYCLSKFRQYFFKKESRKNYKNKSERKLTRKVFAMIQEENKKIKYILLNNMCKEA